MSSSRALDVPAVTDCLQGPHPRNTCCEPTTFPPPLISFLHEPSGAGIPTPGFTERETEIQRRERMCPSDTVGIKPESSWL